MSAPLFFQYACPDCGARLFCRPEGLGSSDEEAATFQVGGDPLRRAALQARAVEALHELHYMPMPSERQN